jgi:hypothetical protein
MKDKTTTFSAKEINEFTKMHGHTTIELTDVSTGKKKIIEHDNDFQAGVLASYMRSLGAFNANPYTNGTWAGLPIWRNLCGGLLCFEDEIDNSQNEVPYMPAGNKMTANGAYMVTNSGTPTEMGSYNSVESHTDGNDSVTFVYDFTTSQGNGTISCVCLTTEVGGYIGYGNRSGNSHDTKKAWNTNQSSRAITGLAYKNNVYTFALDTTNSKISVTKKPTEITKGSIFDNIAEDAVDVTYTGTISGTALSQVIYMGSGKVALFPYSTNFDSIASGGTYSFLIYDLEAETATVKTITNNTGVSLRTRYVNPNHQSQIPIYGITENYIYLREGSGEYPHESGLYAIKLSDSTYNLVDSNVSISIITTRTYQAIGMLLSPGIFAYGSKIYDESTNLAYPTNGIFSDGNYYAGHQYEDVHDAIFNPNTGYVYKNPLLLATVNNLDDSVTKTATQTMKITYTLTKASN